jgi:hypothetical protein
MFFLSKGCKEKRLFFLRELLAPEHPAQLQILDAQLGGPVYGLVTVYG